ncbi:MAG TPA: hypothetical protein VHA52_07860 [Candidatus Babeliaceae bacterium]|nr:hypothetical protein [Candidatus Babeliaceae bacterium]
MKLFRFFLILSFFFVIEKAYSITPEERLKLTHQILSELENQHPNLQKIQQLLDQNADLISNLSRAYKTPLVFEIDKIDPNPKIVLMLLEAGSNPNQPRMFKDIMTSFIYLLIGSGLYRNPHIFSEVFRYFILYGANTDIPEDFSYADLKHKITKIFSQPILQAIALHDIDKLKSNLATAGNKVMHDDNGISALAYASGQGSEEMVSLLLSYPAYQYDTQGIEQALDVVASILRRSKPENPNDEIEYTKYKKIYDDLKAHLNTTIQEQLDLFAQQAYSQNPGLLSHSLPEYTIADMPIEIQQEIFKHLLNQKSWTALFGSGK